MRHESVVIWLKILYIDILFTNSIADLRVSHGLLCEIFNRRHYEDPIDHKKKFVYHWYWRIFVTVLIISSCYVRFERLKWPDHCVLMLMTLSKVHDDIKNWSSYFKKNVILIFLIHHASALSPVIFLSIYSHIFSNRLKLMTRITWWWSRLTRIPYHLI